MSTIKKLVLVVMACVFCLAIVACTKDNKSNDTPAATNTPAPTDKPAQDATPTPTPEPARDLGGLAVVVGDWWSGDNWQLPRNTTADELTADWMEDMMKKHNFTITRKTICGWGDQADTCILSITTNEPLAQVMTFDYRFMGSFMAQEEPLFADVSKLTEFDFKDEKWNKAVIDGMTVGTGIYGFATDKEPRTGIYFNQDLIEQFLGKEYREKPYDWQASGEWTWDKFKEFAKSLTKDTDADGVTDVYGFLVQNSVFAEMAMVSNGCHAVVTRGADGKYVNNATSQEIIDDLNWAYSFYKEGICRPAREDEQSWDFFETRWQEQKCVMIAHDQYRAEAFIADLKDDDGNVTGRAFDFDWGFVCFPKGPKATGYQPVARENVMVIPSCDATKAKLADIAYAYNIFTDKSPEVKDDPAAWKSHYEPLFRDSRAVNETLDIMIHGDLEPFSNPAYIVPGLYDNNNGLIQAKFYYSFDGDQEPAQLLASLNSEIESALNDFNTTKVK